MEQAPKNMKRNFRLMATLYGLAAVLMGVMMLMSDQGTTMKKMFMTLFVAFLVSTVLQIILYNRQKTLFKDKPTHPEYKDGLNR